MPVSDAGPVYATANVPVPRGVRRYIDSRPLPFPTVLYTASDLSVPSRYFAPLFSRGSSSRGLNSGRRISRRLYCRTVKRYKTNAARMLYRKLADVLNLMKLPANVSGFEYEEPSPSSVYRNTIFYVFSRAWLSLRFFSPPPW